MDVPRYWRQVLPLWLQILPYIFRKKFHSLAEQSPEDTMLRLINMRIVTVAVLSVDFSSVLDHPDISKFFFV